jgi:ABC-type transport system substrate-binding protein
MKGNIMKKSILILACAAIAPFAFAQTSTTTTESTTTKTNPMASTTETTTTTTSTDGTVTTFEPGKTIVVRRQGPDGPISYALSKTARFLNRSGAEIEATRIRPGTKVHVYYDGTGETRVVNRVVVDE